jgi:hypothetical protein
MEELSASLTHQVECNLNVIPSKITTLVEGTDGSNTSKVKLSFNLSGDKNDLVQGKWAEQSSHNKSQWNNPNDQI